MLFWLGFLLILEPGNVVRAPAMGVHLDVGHEAMRMAAASLMGSPAAPVLLWLVRRYPIEGRSWPGHGALHLAVIAGLAAGLIVAGRVVAAAIMPAANRSSLSAQLASNVLLMMAAMTGLVIAAHALRRSRATALPEASSADPYLARIPVRDRRGTVVIEAGQIDWIEAQGNYIALHADGATHLIRETLSRFHARLDPGAFVRIHRGAVVSVARVREVRPLGNGDAALKLHGGAELRVSRSYRDGLQARLNRPPPA